MVTGKRPRAAAPPGSLQCLTSMGLRIEPQQETHLDSVKRVSHQHAGHTWGKKGLVTRMPRKPPCGAVRQGGPCGRHVPAVCPVHPRALESWLGGAGVGDGRGTSPESSWDRSALSASLLTMLPPVPDPSFSHTPPLHSPSLSCFLFRLCLYFSILLSQAFLHAPSLVPSLLCRSSLLPPPSSLSPSPVSIPFFHSFPCDRPVKLLPWKQKPSRSSALLSGCF